MSVIAAPAPAARGLFGARLAAGAVLPPRRSLAERNPLSVAGPQHPVAEIRARMRAGLAWDNWLLYGTGGFAYGHVKSSLSYTATAGFGGLGLAVINSNSENLTGWVAGAGVNYGFANWVIGLEWLHYDIGHNRHRVHPSSRLC